MKMKLITILLFVSSISLANYSQSPVNSAKLTDFQVTQETGLETNFFSVLQNNKSLILVPAYFSCSSTCPLLADNLRNSIGSAKLGQESQVVFLSFNPQDTIAAMKIFREHHKLSTGWALITTKSETQAKNLLDQFGYQFQKTKDGFDHPNEAFIFSKQKKLWTGVLLGVENTNSDIDRGLGEANYADLDGITQKLAQILSKPEYLIVIGFFGVALPLLLILFILFKKSRRIEGGLSL